MAQLIPTISTDEIKNYGERLFAECLLKQAPARVQVFHSINWLAENREGTVREGESDFVILDPERGILFVEVKGGTIRCCPDSFEWVRVLDNGVQEKIKSPFVQARASMHTLTNKMKTHPLFRSGIPFTYGYAAAFPGCRCDGTLPADIRPELIFDANRCQSIQASLKEAFDLNEHPGHERMNASHVRAVHEVLYPNFGVTPVLWRQVEDQEAKLRRLTAEQAKTLKLLKNQSKALIRGVAGSGKTILAVAKAQEIARDGVKTLFVCYNKQLKHWLDASAEKIDDNLAFCTFHELAFAFAKKAGIPLYQRKDEDDEAFWNNRVPDVMMQAASVLGEAEKYDAIIVDEGQDFHDLWWLCIDGVFKDPANKQCFYIFYDPLQNIYVTDPSLPSDMGKPFELDENCRNTVRIAQHCEAFVNSTITVRDDAPVGEEPEVIQAQTVEQAFRLAEKKVRELCFDNHGGLERRQVAVLADGATKARWPRRIAGFDTTEYLPTWKANKAILLDSWARFKGLEADAIILIDTDKTDTPKSRANRYVSRSRAKHLLTIIEVENV
jgi:hypothetical protein